MNTVWYHLYVETERKKNNTKQKQIHPYREQTCGYQIERRGKGIIGVRN